MNAVEAANSMPPMNAGIIVVVDRKDIPASMLVPNKTLPVKAMMPTHGITMSAITPHPMMAFLAVLSVLAAVRRV